MSEANKSNREPRMPKVWESCITLAALIGVLAIGIVIFGAAVHVPMFVGVCVAALMALYLGHKWDSIEKMMMDGIYKALQSICILIIVGILIGVWINAGVVPTMIYYGLKIMHPAIFFIACVLICSCPAHTSAIRCPPCPTPPTWPPPWLVPTSLHTSRR